MMKSEFVISKWGVFRQNN